LPFIFVAKSRQQDTAKPVVAKKPLPAPVTFDVEQPPKKTKPTMNNKQKKPTEKNESM